MFEHKLGYYYVKIKSMVTKSREYRCEYFHQWGTIGENCNIKKGEF